MVHKVLWICLERCLNSSNSRLSPTTLLLLLFFPALLLSFDFKVASYNVENLFDMNYNGSEYKEYIPNKHGWSRDKLAKKLLNISEVICDIDADIIGLQEIENKNVLKQLQTSLRKVGCTYKYLAITHKKDSAIQVAILSKIPIQSKKEIVVNRKLGYRNILEVKIIINNNPLFVYVNHWKSKASKERKRIISAKALRRRLQELSKGSEYILLGDFNSNYDEYLKVPFTGINHILKTINRDGIFIRPYSIGKNSFEHYNLWLDLPNYRRWSHNFYGDKQGLDAILLPYTMFDGKGIDYIINSFYVFKKSYLFHKKGYIFRWVYKKGRHKGKGYSDHLPIVASFSTNKPFANLEQSISKGYIRDILNKNCSFPILLENVKVVFKDKKVVEVEDSISKEKIIIYGGEDSFILGSYYNIVVYGVKLYKNKYEIVDFGLKKRYYSTTKKKD